MSRAPDHPTTREIERDEQIVAGSLLRGLVQVLLEVLDNLLLQQKRPELAALHARVEGVLGDATQARRHLNDERIARRAERHNEREAAPEPAHPFRHHGAYIGSFPSLQAVAANALSLDGLANTRLARYDLTGLALDLHLNGVLWTIDIDGELHTFRPRPRGPRESP